MALLASLLLLLALPGTASAHADLVTASPADGEVLTTVPAEIVLTFSEGLTDASSYSVLDAAGATVATGTPDPADGTGAVPRRPADGRRRCRGTLPICRQIG